jgi:hypothetical protein
LRLLRRACGPLATAGHGSGNLQSQFPACI